MLTKGLPAGMEKNGLELQNGNYDRQSAFKTVLPLRDYSSSSRMMSNLLFVRCQNTELQNDQYSPIAALERFVENYFNEECKEDNLKPLSMRQSFNPCTELPQRTGKKMVFSEFQNETLEKNFKFKPYLTPPARIWLANLLGLSKQQVVTWFQNRRAKERKRAGVKLPRHGRKCIFGNFETSRQVERNNLENALAWVIDIFYHDIHY